MTTSKRNKFLTGLTFLLVAAIIAGGAMLWRQLCQHQPVEISISNPTSQPAPGYIYIGGEVVSPGIYPLRAGDSLESLLQAAGGGTTTADLSTIRLLIPAMDEGEGPQKVDINRAEAWLLQALPGIGETRAQAIIDYRRQNGPFRHTSELTKVEGIGPATYHQIRELITVAD